tara:strand:- start:529 stop:954 length:426 start_codon:yes stop_codon:yes gene_type:complete
LILRIAWRNNRFSLSVRSKSTRKTLFSSEFESPLIGDTRVGAVLEFVYYQHKGKMPSKVQLRDLMNRIEEGKIIKREVAKSDVKIIGYLIQNSLVTKGQDMVLPDMLKEAINLRGKKIHVGPRVTYVNNKVFPDMERVVAE